MPIDPIAIGLALFVGLALLAPAPGDWRPRRPAGGRRGMLARPAWTRAPSS
jgi:hypothetical protein